MFKHKNTHKGMWRFSNRLYVNQIDHVLVNSRFTNTVLVIKSARGTDCDTRHMLVVGELKVTLKKKRSVRKIETKSHLDVQNSMNPLLVRSTYLK